MTGPTPTLHTTAKYRQLSSFRNPALHINVSIAPLSLSQSYLLYSLGGPGRAFTGYFTCSENSFSIRIVSGE
jgi:hypothetical protein